MKKIGTAIRYAILLFGAVGIIMGISSGGISSSDRAVYICLGVILCTIALVSVIRWILISVTFLGVGLSGFPSIINEGQFDLAGLLTVIFCLSVAAYFGYKAGLQFRQKRFYKRTGTSLSDIDKMSGLEFEHFTAQLLRQLGYTNVAVTKASGDQGIDVLATKAGIRYAIQCKNYSNRLDNTPVQEAYAGKQFYGYDVGVVMTNSTFTQGAQELANAIGVLLWDRNVLHSMIYEATHVRKSAPQEAVLPKQDALISTTLAHDDSSVTLSAHTPIANTEEVTRGLRLGVSDERFYDAVDAILDEGIASVSVIQRRLNLGYARAARIMDEMELKGIVGPFRGSTPRDILISAEQWILICSQRFTVNKNGSCDFADDLDRPKYTEVDEQFISEAQWYSSRSNTQE